MAVAILCGVLAVRRIGSGDRDNSAGSRQKGDSGSSDAALGPEQHLLPLPTYPGQPLTEEQARQVIAEFARIQLPDTPLKRFASGVAPEQRGTRGIISFTIDPVLIPGIVEDIRKVGRELMALPGNEYYFGEVVGSSGLTDVVLDETTHMFRLTSQDNRLVLPEEISKDLSLEPDRFTKDFQIFLYLCPSNGTFHLLWQHYPD